MWFGTMLGAISSGESSAAVFAALQYGVAAAEIAAAAVAVVAAATAAVAVVAAAAAAVAVVAAVAAAVAGAAAWHARHDLVAAALAAGTSVAVAASSALGEQSFAVLVDSAAVADAEPSSSTVDVDVAGAEPVVASPSVVAELVAALLLDHFAWQDDGAAQGGQHPLGSHRCHPCSSRPPHRSSAVCGVCSLL